MMVGDHPALEILNTAARVDGELVDSLASDRDVLLWLSRVGWPAENDLAHLRADALLKSARALRATIRVLIEKRKAGKRSDPRALNVFLAHARSHLELVSNRGERSGIPPFSCPQDVSNIAYRRSPCSGHSILAELILSILAATENHL
jgi:predicted RNA-binding Zn ribbon-like protein